MSVLISYDVSDGKQQDFKDWLMQNKGWKNMVGAPEEALPESTLMKPSEGEPSAEVNAAINDMDAAKAAVGTEIVASIVMSTRGAFQTYRTGRFTKLKGTLK